MKWFLLILIFPLQVFSQALSSVQLGSSTIITNGPSNPVPVQGIVAQTGPWTSTVFQGTNPWNVGGSLTCNAGTNLNTSALALDSNVQTVNTTLSLFKSANHTDLALINTTLGSPFQAGGAISNTSFIANAGTNLNTSALALESGGHLASIDSKVPPLGQAAATGSVPVVLTAAQLATLTPLTTVGVTQSTSPWLTSRNWTASTTTDSMLVAQTGPWAVTANIGTTNGLALDTSVNSLLKPASTLNAVTTLGSITNALPTGSNNIGSVNAVQSGSWTDTVVQPTASLLNATVVGPSGTTLAKDSSLTTINTTLGSPFQAGGAIANTGFIANAGANLNTSALNLEATQSAFKTTNHTDLVQIDTDLLSFKSANHSDLIAIEPRNLAQVNGITVNTGIGASTGGTQRVAVSNDSKIQPWDGTNSQSYTAAGEAKVNVTTTVLPPNAAIETGGHLAAIDTTTAAFKTANHTDLVQLDTDLLAFKTANHTDITQVDTDLVAFKNANHTDLLGVQTDVLQVDTDLLAFKSANHTDLSTINTAQTNGTQKSQVVDASNNTMLSTLVNAIHWFNVTNPAIGVVGSTGAPNSAMQFVGGIDPYNKLRPFTLSENDRLRVETGYHDSFDRNVALTLISQIQVRFDLSIASNYITPTTAGSGSTSQANGRATIATGTAATSSAKLVTNNKVVYHPFRGVYSAFTAAFTTPTSSSSEQRIGIYDANNGFFLGYHGTVFGFTVRNGGVDTFTALTAAGLDPVDGSANSLFTRNRVPEALDFTKENIYLIDYAWLGSAPINIRVFSPDSRFVGLFIVRQPNTSSSPSIQTPSLPVTAEVTKTSSDATNLQMFTSSWDAGVVDSDVGLAPEDVRGRKAVSAIADAVTASTNVYTVSTGRTLRITGGNINCFNTSLVAAGHIQITDGSGGTVVFPLSMNTATNQSSSTITAPFTFPTGLKFTNGIFLNMASGTNTCSAIFLGYEAEQ